MGTPRARLPRGLSIIVLVLLFFMDSPGMQSAEAISCWDLYYRIVEMAKRHNSHRPFCPPENPSVCTAYDEEAARGRQVISDYNKQCARTAHPNPTTPPTRSPEKPKIDSYEAAEKVFTRYPRAKLSKTTYLTGSKQEMEKAIQELTQGREPINILYPEGKGTVKEYELGDGARMNVRDFSTSGGKGDPTVDLMNPKNGKRNIKLHIGQ